MVKKRSGRNDMTHLARLRQHPADEAALIVSIPHELNYEMARFQPAILATEHKGYVLLAEHLPSLQRFAQTVNLRIIDERAAPEGSRTLMPECANCGQPAKLGHEPRRCPSCGGVWSSTFLDGLDNRRGLTQTCPIGHTQQGAFPYCGTCGAPIEPTKPSGPPAILRQVLADPKPLADVIAETVDLLAPAEEAS